MSGLTVVSETDDLVARLGPLLEGRHAVRRVWEAWQEPTHAVEMISAASPTVVAIGNDVLLEDIDTLLRAMDIRRPDIGVVVFRDEVDAGQTVDILRMGARDVLEVSWSDRQIVQVLDSVFRVMGERRASFERPADEHRHRLITVLSPKGGTGKTTVSANLATGLASRMPGRVVLVDLDVQFGDVASATGADPEHTLVDAVARGSLDPTTLKVYLTQLQSGLNLLTPPDDLVLAEDIYPDGIKGLLGLLHEEYSFVVVDTGAGIDEFALLAMEMATDFLFVTTTDVPGVLATKKQIDALDRLGMNSAYRTLVLNRADARVGLSVADIEATIGLKVDHEIPSSRSVPLSTNQGVPVISAGNSDAVTRAFQEIIDGYRPPKPSERTGRRFFKRS